jgi:hypothetical protein
VVLDDVGGVAGLPLVEVHRDEVEVDRRALAEPHQDVEERPAVLPAGDRDHDPVGGLDEAEVGDRVAGGAEELLLEAGGHVLHRRTDLPDPLPGRTAGGAASIFL